MVGFVFTFNINHPSSLSVAEPPALGSPANHNAEREARVRVGRTKRHQGATAGHHNVEGRCSCTCREKPGIGPSLETSERQHDYLGICLRHSLHVIFEMTYAEKRFA
jgi:hypothetical protein